MPPLVSINLNPSRSIKANAGEKVSDWDKKYPPDKFGEEFSENARLWKVYKDEAEKSDGDKLALWNQTLDVLLLFVSHLFRRLALSG
jgi:hypothetical protein